MYRKSLPYSLYVYMYVYAYGGGHVCVCVPLHSKTGIHPDARRNLPEADCKMSAMLRFRLEDKLPKPKYPEEYKKHIPVDDASKENWTLPCNFCNLGFKGRVHHRNCHSIGEGVSVCNEIPACTK